MSRRMALALVAGVEAAGVKITPPMPPMARAVQSGFTTVTGDGFKVDIPSKWNPSKETEFPGITLRYEDNFDAMFNTFGSVTKAAKGSITDYGPPDKFLDEEACVYNDHCPLSEAVKHVGLGLRGMVSG